MPEGNDMSRELKGNLDLTLHTLSMLLQCAGKTYIVIDGLDEIKGSTQQIFLDRLIRLVEECEDTKLLLVSRKGHVLNRALQDVSTIINVEQNNTGCIRSYVKHWSKEWFDRAGFDDEACIGIRKMLFPIPMKAKGKLYGTFMTDAKNLSGMFLYARLVLENIEALRDIETIQEELRVLPETLDEIYGRVIQRIFNPLISSSGLAKRILSWVACSSVPLTRQEMEQALLIKPHSRTVPNVAAPLNYLQLCGPLIDTHHGDKLQLVHFTVKEYIMNRNRPFINEEGAILDIAKTYINYLCCDNFDPFADDDEVQEYLRVGVYRLFRLAESQWAESMKQLARCSRREIPQELLELLQQFLVIRSNVRYAESTESKPNIWGLDSLKETPEIQKLLSQFLAHQLWQKGADNCRLDEEADNAWVDQDPTTLSITALQIHQNLEGLICPDGGHKQDCHCSSLKKHYGPRLFKCSYVACRFRSIGFEQRSTRDRHIKHHSRPFKCPVQTCEYFFIGFLSQAQCDQHYNHLHKASATINDTDSLYEDFREDELERVSLDFVDCDDIEEMKRLMHVIEYSPRKDTILRHTGELVAHSGSLEMAKIVFMKARKYELHPYLEKSIEGGNLPVFAWLCEPIDEHYSTKITMDAIASGSLEIFDIWKDFLIRTNQTYRALENESIPRKLAPDVEVRLAEFWKEQHVLGKLRNSNGRLSGYKGRLNERLVEAGKYACSPQLAETLLQLGANPNYKKEDRGQKTKQTPLIYASLKMTKAAVDTIKVLLLGGADPHHERKITFGSRKGTVQRAADGAGAKGISKWLSMAWDELVQWAKEEREKGRGIYKNEDFIEDDSKTET
ncbi:uncharacterized protein F4822DRAFT_427697 [Hypoxylon trugodes]|uniref:uncharacterized protein n=1 Tax=Hypoxylon trugodes TaxID=326681 RepID=UPI0021989033|nr:uncharacterized protein F4822DRAFT_427697 [Hypoxylon trugodes]KAI1389344.1 hypothetical protein F4822DRAFT_427697 [Hypoxylon trugodes]